ncbi:hypothetical protein QQ020_23355 [Fulvivirgaceae bacterium BMA12]|uniref:Replication protein n=1 Tax=Agaribacillus aureus TaxID=3051825 RepID=A0ABT8LB94_9BACT|nr:hypothetical protein [Fulvivirgaceae bacterium BMA12]
MDNQEIPITRHYFDFSETFSRTKNFIDQYNATQRKLTDKLNANHRATAELIVRLYLKQLNKASRIDKIDPQNPPGFRTYNTSLATCKGCTKRTILNHKERLRQAGFIVDEKHKGVEGVEIWINKAIFGKAELCTDLGEGMSKISHLRSIFLPEAKKIPPLVHEQHEHYNINSNVDKLTDLKIVKEISGVRSAAHGGGMPAVQPSSPSDTGEAAGTGHEPCKNIQKSVAPALSKEKSSVKNLEKGSVKKQEQIPKKKYEQISGEAGHLFLLSLVKKFWEYARDVLYPDIILSDPEEREVLNLIWESVYGKFRLKASEKEWLKFHESAITRVDMVAKWLTRRSIHWIAKPHLYFHPHNDRNGFRKTWEWYLRQETLKLEIRNQLALQQAKHELSLHNQGKGQFKNKSRIQLFRIHEKRLRQYKDQALLDAYYVCLQKSLHGVYIDPGSS